jgi:hypothetical protein
MILKCEGPALKAGIQIRDRMKDETRRRIGELLKTLKPGDPVDLRILRENQELVFRVVLGEPQASDRHELR